MQYLISTNHYEKYSSSEVHSSGLKLNYNVFILIISITYYTYLNTYILSAFLFCSQLFTVPIQLNHTDNLVKITAFFYNIDFYYAQRCSDVYSTKI